MLEIEGGRPERRRFVLTPAVATIAFFAIQLLLSLGDGRKSEIGGAAADAPAAIPVKVRVVAQIRSQDDAPRKKSAVPTTEAALLDLLRREGSVIFSSEEVEVVSTPEQEFGPEEVDVIHLRRARLADR
jgi:hypothetical protein